jgi:hypothetical protein
MSTEYISTNSGILTVDNVKEGDKLVIIEDAYSTFNEAKQKTYWNCKVMLPNKTEKLAGLMDSTCDKFVTSFGKMTGDWTGHTVVVSIKQSKAGKDYIVLTPTDDPIVETVEEQVAPAVEPVKGVEYPKNEINPEDIPF